MSVDRIALFGTESRRIAAYLKTLSEAALAGPSSCLDWSVSDVIAHMVSANYADSLQRGLKGDTSPPLGAPAAGELDPDALAQRIGLKAPSDRKKYGRRLLQAFVERNGRLLDVLETIKADDWTRFCYHPRGVITVRQLVDLAVFELVVHEWDIRSVLEPTARLSAPTLQILVDRLPELVKRSFRLNGLENISPSFRFDVTGPIAGSWVVILDQKSVQMEPVTATVTRFVECETETFVLMLIGRLGLRAATETGRATVLNHPEQVDLFEQSMRGI